MAAKRWKVAKGKAATSIIKNLVVGVSQVALSFADGTVEGSWVEALASNLGAQLSEVLSIEDGDADGEKRKKLYEEVAEELEGTPEGAPAVLAEMLSQMASEAATTTGVVVSSAMMAAAIAASEEKMREMEKERVESACAAEMEKMRDEIIMAKMGAVWKQERTAGLLALKKEQKKVCAQLEEKVGEVEEQVAIAVERSQQAADEVVSLFEAEITELRAAVKEQVAERRIPTSAAHSEEEEDSSREGEGFQMAESKATKKKRKKKEKKQRAKYDLMEVTGELVEKKAWCLHGDVNLKKIGEAAWKGDTDEVLHLVEQRALVLGSIAQGCHGAVVDGEKLARLASFYSFLRRGESEADASGAGAWRAAHQRFGSNR